MGLGENPDIGLHRCDLREALLVFGLTCGVLHVPGADTHGGSLWLDRTLAASFGAAIRSGPVARSIK